MHCVLSFPKTFNYTIHLSEECRRYNYSIKVIKQEVDKQQPTNNSNNNNTNLSIQKWLKKVIQHGGHVPGGMKNFSINVTFFFIFINYRLFVSFRCMEETAIIRRPKRDLESSSHFLRTQVNKLMVAKISYNIYKNTLTKK